MPTKKVVAKKSTAGNLKNAKRVLVQAQGEQCFWTNDGSIIATLVDLANLLDTIHADVFAHHVQKGKNDFSDWVEFVLGDAELANSLRNAKTAKSAHTAVVRRLKIYDI